MISKKIFAERLTDLRKQKSITMKELATTINITKAAVGNLENEYRSPSLDTIVALADFFNVSIDYLVGRTNNPNINL